MKDSFSKSRHQYGSFVMVIVGNSQTDFWLWVSLHDGKTYLRLDKELSSLDE